MPARSLETPEFPSSTATKAVLSFPPMADSFDSATPQFGTAEYGGKTGGDHCHICQQPISGKYYRVNDAMGCGKCVGGMLRERKQDAPAAYVRALAAGVGAAVVGMLGYALIAILLQGWVISYMSIAVGFLVSTAMMKGSHGVGGRRYQITAVLLTYAAVSMSAVPIGLYFVREHREQKLAQQHKLEDEQQQLEQEFGAHGQATKPAARPAARPMSAMNVGTWLARLAWIGLTSPFLALSESPGWGAMGLLILFFGMRIAWRIAAGKPLQVYGPF